MMAEYLTLYTATELVRIAYEHIIYISSDGNYSSIHLPNGETRIVTFQLNKIEALLNHLKQSDRHQLLRVGKQFIVNCDYIYYINPSKKQLILMDRDATLFPLQASTDALKELKTEYENKLEQKLEMIIGHKKS